MKPVLSIMRMLATGQIRAFAQGMALSIVVLLMGVGLLALSGWFITAAAAAGIIGLGTLFNVFAPSAMVRFLALGRTAARYGERLATHDATLRALSKLRVRLLEGVLAAPYRQVERLRASVFLNRITSDVDALDGLALRLIVPGVAGLAVIGAASLTVGLLVSPMTGLVLVLGYGVGPTLVFLGGQKRASAPSRKAQTGMQALRSRLIDLIAARDELIAFGQISVARDSVSAAAMFQSESQADVERTERLTGFLLDLMGWAAVAASLWIGASLAQTGDITAAQAAIGIFAALALSEAVAPVRRALSEIGKMRSAARRVARLVDRQPGAVAGTHQPAFAGPLVLGSVCAARGGGDLPLFAPVDLTVAAGHTVALTGRSGCGKSTLLLIAAGQIAPASGMVHFGGAPVCDMDAQQRSRLIAMLPQRHALVAGTIADNLRLAAPDASDGALWAALEAMQIGPTIVSKGGLEARLGFRGAGLSGGEGRRLALARIVLRRPRLLLLDEPTEGLDGPLARAVLAGLRQALPEAAILMAAHRPEEVDFADRIVKLDPAPNLA